MLPKEMQIGPGLWDRGMVRGTSLVIVCFFVLVAITAIGRYHSTHVSVPPKPLTFSRARTAIGDRLIGNLRGENIRDNLRVISAEPHVAGTEANHRVGEKILELWKKNGLEDVHFVDYDVLLSYPDYTNPNHLSVLDRRGNVVYQSNGTSPAVLDEQKDPHAGVQWVAYSAPGTVDGEPVYCHYGRPEDFARLEKLGISLVGRIALLRYSHGFRGDKVAAAQANGAIGAVLFSDPSEVAREGTDDAHVYPRTEWLPSFGAQRGSVMHMDGDPLTPLSPSKYDLYPTRTIEEAKAEHTLPSIPVLPLSYHDIFEILSRMSGRPVPLDWQGGLNVTYRLGPGLRETGSRLRLEVRASYEKRHIRNVVGYIKGAQVPDEYVILGNHYDAWVYGSLDPNSGTATLAEVGRAMVQTMNQTGWRPARTVMFCNWDAEEFGLVGSTEFVEEFEKQLSERAVVYFNVDTIFSNLSFAASTTPTLFQAVVDTAKRIPNPMQSELKRARKTVYDTWVRAFPGDIPSYPSFPQMDIPGGGSDHAPFLNFLGVPVVDFRYRNTSWSEYPLYHSLYETPFFNEHIFDTSSDNIFGVHRAVGQFWAEIARLFADSPVAPLNVTVLADQLLNRYVHDLKSTLDPLKHRYPAANAGRVQLSHLIRNCQEFVRQARNFDLHARHLQQYDVSPEASALTRRLMGVERCFVNVYSRPDHPQKRHVLFSVSDKDSYASSVMAGVYDAIQNLVDAPTDAERAKAGRVVAQEISDVQTAVQCATKTLINVI